MAQTKVSLIISVYNDMAALALILKSICKQSYKGAIEVIIAEDKQCINMHDQILKWRHQYIFPIKHINQEDIGFRKCKILNEAIRTASGDYLIFIDGDCVLHKHFIREHVLCASPGTIVYGRRVMLSSFLSRQLLQSQQFYWLKFIYLLLSACKRLDAALYLPFTKPQEKIGFWGHNWSIHSKDIKQVKGFDESYEQAGIGEDTDIEWRLQQMGMRFFRIKNRAIQYHLFHESHYPNTQLVEAILAQKKQKFEAGDSSVLLGNL
ncbi:MAG: glycosyltransferase [Bacteroidota bacterium]|nr:glycosyltransferase [Bacteroidota bacterium]